MARIRQKPFDPSRMRLSPEEGFVLSRVDGRVTARELVALTGLPAERIDTILERLRAEDAIEVEGAAPAAQAAVDDALRAFLAGDAGGDAPGGDAPGGDAPGGDAPEAEPLEPTEAAADGGDAEANDGDDAGDPGEEEGADKDVLYRRLYETTYRALERDLRVKAAAALDGAPLFALGLDPEPAVIHALLANPRATLDHVRYVALHHRTQSGLDGIARRSDHVADRVVQRRLLRNPQLPGTLLARIAGGRQLIEVYKVAIDREIPERSRGLVREILRKKFTVASADEKAAFLFKTEGRCLLLLVNCSLDAHATQILCSRQTYTPMLIQNLGRWSATPPAILVHLLKQPSVKRNAGLRKMILKHPNTPSDAKRQG